MTTMGGGGGHAGGDSELFFLGPRLHSCSLGQKKWGTAEACGGGGRHLLIRS